MSTITPTLRSLTTARRPVRKAEAATMPPYTPPQDQLVALAFGWAITKQGFSGQYAADLIRAIQNTHRELDERRASYVQPAQWEPGIETSQPIGK